MKKCLPDRYECSQRRQDAAGYRKEHDVVAAVDKASSQKSQVHSKACAGENSWKHDSKRHTHRGRKDSKTPKDDNRQIQADGEEHWLEKSIDQKTGKNCSENSRKVACVPRDDR